MGSEAQKRFYEALQKFGRAELINSGSACYQIACCHALLGNEDKCSMFLEKARTTETLPNKALLEADDDLDKLRQKSWFKIFMNNLPS